MMLGNKRTLSTVVDTMSTRNLQILSVLYCIYIECSWFVYLSLQFVDMLLYVKNGMRKSIRPISLQ